MLEILQIVDELILSQTGKHLDRMQKAIIEGTWHGQTYTEIAKEHKYSESRVRDIGYKLWQILSEKLELDINKFNFRSTIERLELTTLKDFNKLNNNICDFCPYSQLHINKKRNVDFIKKTFYCNLKQSPKTVNCYSRDNELLTISEWIKIPEQMIIFVLGNAGIGKSTIVRSVIDLQMPLVDVVIWKNVSLSNSLESLINEILNDTKNLKNPPESDRHVLDQLLDLLIAKRCLFILDNLEEIFQPQKLIGQYKLQYQGYQRFLKLITEVKHQSQFILISQKKYPEMQCLQPNLYPIRCLELTGVKDTKILESLQLKNEKFFPDLINLYEGNPGYLQDIAIFIRDIFDGDVGKFMAENSLIITENMASQLEQLFSQFSPIEQVITLALAKNRQPASKDQLIKSLNISSIELMKGLHSLQRRYLVNTIQGESILFNLSAVWQEYLQTLL